MADEYKNGEEENDGKVSLPCDASKILEQAKQEIELSRKFVQTKRQEFRDRLKLYNNQRKQRDKIGDTTLYNVMNTLLAVYYTDDLEVTFAGREVGDITQAANTDDIARFDHEEMEMDVLNYLTQWDRFFFGVGIRELAEWDNYRKTPKPKSLDPLSWLPDPAGYLLVKNFRWHGFENEYLKSELTSEAGFFNVEDLSARDSNKGSERDQTRDFMREAQGLDNPEMNESRFSDVVFDLIDLYTCIQGDDGIKRRYILTVSDDLKTLVRCEELMPVTDEEKESPDRVPYPITLNYYSPTRSDPFGVSVADLVEDKQRAKSVLKNLRIAARKADLYPMYLYNRDKILNRRDLDFAFNKFIAVRGDVGDNVVLPLNKQSLKQGEILNDEQSMAADIEAAVGTDKITQGVLSDQSRTLGEVQQTMANANLRFILGTRINSWGEKRFWKLWYRSYRQNLSASEKKVIRLRSAVGNRFSTFVRKDFITKEDPDIRIVSKFQLQQERTRDRLAFTSVFPIIMQNPTKPESSKLYAERKMLRLLGMPEDEIAVIAPDTPDEIRAKQENELLSRNQKVKVDVASEDHLSHIVVHAQAEPSAALDMHISMHREAYYMSGQAAKDQMMRMQTAMQKSGQGGQNSMMNSSFNQENAQANSSGKPQEIAQAS